MSVLSNIRDAVYTAIAAKKLASLYTYNNFDLEWTYFPYQRITELSTNGKVYVIGLAKDDEIFSRENAAMAEVPVQIGLQRQLKPGDKTLIDTMIQLEEQLRDTARLLDTSDYAWVRNRSLKDANGTPYAYMAMREGNLFEAYFTAYYQFPFA